MSKSKECFTTEFRVPHSECNEASGVSTWLAELQKMRGEVLFEQGRRPAFQHCDGSCSDADALDREAYHVIVRSRGEIAGCARITPINRPDSAIVSAIGDRRFEEVMNRMGVNPKEVCEASRWIVRPLYRKSGLAWQLVATSWAVARWLGVKFAFVMAGTRDGQDSALARMGARPVDDVPKIMSEIYADVLRLLYFDVANPNASMRRAANIMVNMFGFECLDSMPGLEKNMAKWGESQWQL
jgi:predicted GNAT family N-acyltransferase